MEEIRLNIYKNGKAIKTYTSTTCELMYGPVEDVMDMIDIEKFSKLENVTDKDLLIEAIKVISKAKNTVNEIVMQIFPGITENELRCTKIIELANVIIKTVKYSLTELGSLMKGKN